MQVTLSLKDWTIEQDKETALPKVTGKYAVMMGDKEIATQTFNSGYGSKTMPFSGDVIGKLVELEKQIKLELEKVLS